MKGLLIKDFYMAIKYCRYSFFIIAIFAVIGVFQENNSFFVTYSALLVSIIPITLISYDEKSKWNIYCDVLPYKRSQVVSSKYIGSILSLLVVVILTSIICSIRMVALGNFSFQQLYDIASIQLLMGLVSPIFIFPFVFKFGTEKGRIAYYILIGFIVSIASMSVIISKDKIDLSFLSEWLSLILPIAALLAYTVSWRISILIYKNREL